MESRKQRQNDKKEAYGEMIKRQSQERNIF
jgi:hypothetical protein